VTLRRSRTIYTYEYDADVGPTKKVLCPAGEAADVGNLPGGAEGSRAEEQMDPVVTGTSTVMSHLGSNKSKYRPIGKCGRQVLHPVIFICKNERRSREY
jgi:hypothetical protein